MTEGKLSYAGKVVLGEALIAMLKEDGSEKALAAAEVLQGQVDELKARIEAEGSLVEGLGEAEDGKPPAQVVGLKTLTMDARAKMGR